MTDLFKTATKAKTRFQSEKGNLTTEDLWSLTLTQLNTVAKAIAAEIKNEGEEDFIGGGSKTATALTFKLDVVKAVIAEKQADAAATKNAAAVSQERAKLLDLLAKKEDASLEALSADEIRAKLAQLGG